MRSNDTGSREQREPMPTEAQAEHGLRMLERIAAAAREADGWLSFERYMDLALYAPGLGYYSAGARKFGSDGDFTTAPEISPLFAACVARQCAETLRELPGAVILEIGAGTGRMAVDVLRTLQAHDRLPDRYWILETSADLRERQLRTIETGAPQLLGRVAWLDTPPLQAFDGVVLANEVLDALPVARFRWRRRGTTELGVSVRDGALVEAERPASPAVAAHCETLRAAGGEWSDGYTSEYCPRLPAWTAAVTAGLRRGAALWIDYGLPRRQFYLPERRDGTLLCHYRQRAHADALHRPGLQDITAWVDFTALAEAGAAAGFAVAGYTTQTYFLAANGIDAELQRLCGGDDGRRAQLANQARRLLLPGEMGERFKAMWWLRGIDSGTAGFRLRDLRHTL
jgi:SAM-dependent MidA family methyltransferase